MSRTAAVALSVTLLLCACADDGAQPTPSRSSPTSPSTTVRPSPSTTAVPSGPPGLLRPERLDGDWVVLGPADATTEHCGRPARSRVRSVASESTQLHLRNPAENDTVVTQEIIRYESEQAATAALEAFRSLADVCPRSTRPDDDGVAQLSLEPSPIAGHPGTVCLLLSVQWADGTGQLARLTATRYGSAVSFLDVDAVQGGYPSDQHVAGILAAVPTTPADGEGSPAATRGTAADP